jgi:hypothetical protein
VQAEVDRYLEDKEQRFAAYAQVLGAVDACRREILRRYVPAHEAYCANDELGDWAEDFYDEVVAPYEDKAILKNGDVT